LSIILARIKSKSQGQWICLWGTSY